MQDELDRSMAAMSKSDPPDYFISYTVADREYSEVSGSNGALLASGDTRARWLEVQTRVGTYQLDDTHKLADRQPSWTSPGTSATVDDDIPVLRREIWRETDRQYRAATQALIKVKTSQEVQVQTAEGSAPDFSREEPHVSIGTRVEIKVDRKPWEERVRKYTAAVQQVAGSAEFHRHVHRAGHESVSGEHRRHQAGFRPGPLPPRALRAKQSAGRHGHQPLRQFRLAGSQGRAVR